ncbi:flagellar biosynthetic protein FliO [Falsiroseomonas sp. CW058]|uniref:flagellar biosynthetic protein FliO n=1 Tax=Falsiroseomonas sp. CW058 TaxID=3388664 RepID=UPI003D322F75
MDSATIGTAVGALAAVLGLIVLVGQVAKRLRLAPGTGGGAGRRLAVVEALPLDARRRALLLRCDDRQFLVVTGGGQDVVLPLPGGTA